MAADAKAKTATKKAAARRKAATKDSQFRNFTPYKPKRSEEYLSEGQLDHLRGILSQWRTQLMEEVDRTVNHMQDDAGHSRIQLIVLRKRKSSVSSYAPVIASENSSRKLTGPSIRLKPKTLATAKPAVSR